jgi:hypothetical protein
VLRCGVALRRAPRNALSRVPGALEPPQATHRRPVGARDEFADALLARFSKTKHRKRAIPKAIICRILPVLPSCIHTLRKADPGPPLPEDFNRATNSENSSQVAIEEFYNDQRLIQLIDRALSPVGNRELKILDEDIQIASNEILARSGAYLPFVTLGAGAGLDRYSRFTEEGAGLNNRPIGHAHGYGRRRQWCRHFRED